MPYTELSIEERATIQVGHYSSYLCEPCTFKPLALLNGEGKNSQIYHYQLDDHLGTPQKLSTHRGLINR